ncbi:MAG: hypothetical protein K6T94_26580 [Paenibacillus sp.]|nr:hypothetical protein [Paenibacillus sp.]
MVEQSSSLQVVIWLLTTFVPAIIVSYFIYRYIFKKTNNMRLALFISVLPGTIILAILFGIGFGASFLDIIFGIVLSAVIGLLYVNVMWRIRSKVYGKDKEF